jgi:hypothetical protein
MKSRGICLAGKMTDWEGIGEARVCKAIALSGFRWILDVCHYGYESVESGAVTKRLRSPSFKFGRGAVA